MAHVGFPLPPDERERLDALAQFHLVDTPPEADFERLTALAARLFKVPTVLISLIEQNRQFFKSRIGFDPCETSRDVSFCAHAILDDGIMVVQDARRDPRFKTNPLVVGSPFIRFYAGKPLITGSGYKVGTICLIDSVARGSFSGEERGNLHDLSELIMERMEAHRLNMAAATGRLDFEQMAATSRDAVFLCDKSGRVTFWNRASERLFGFSAADILLQQKLFRVIEDADRPRYHHAMDFLIETDHGDKALSPVNIQAVRKDGTKFTAELSPVILIDSEHKRIGFVVRNLTQRNEIENRLLRCLHSHKQKR